MRIDTFLQKLKSLSLFFFFIPFQRTGPSDLYSKPPKGNPMLGASAGGGGPGGPGGGPGGPGGVDDLNDEFTDDETSPLTEPIYNGR